MKVIPREDRRITYSTHIRDLKKRLSLNEYQRSVVIGNILGDGHLAENWSKTNYRLKMTHSVQQLEYVLWKYAVLREWFLSEPKYYEKTKSITVRTISHSALTAFRRLFYREGKKVIPDNIEDLLHNPVTIAVWFMDDGNIVKRKEKIVGYHLNTQSYTMEENYILTRALERVHGVEATLEKNHGKYRIAIYKKQARERFVDVINNYILKSMRYKLS